jgi:hypothetical protein
MKKRTKAALWIAVFALILGTCYLIAPFAFPSWSTWGVFGTYKIVAIGGLFAIVLYRATR